MTENRAETHKQAQRDAFGMIPACRRAWRTGECAVKVMHDCGRLCAIVVVLEDGEFFYGRTKPAPKPMDDRSSIDPMDRDGDDISTLEYTYGYAIGDAFEYIVPLRGPEDMHLLIQCPRHDREAFPIDRVEVMDAVQESRRRRGKTSRIIAKR